VATEVKLPRLGQGMESGTIVKWLKSEGDAVEKGEALYELDTDKVTQEVEAEASGVLLKIAVQEGEVEVGRTIALIGEQGEAVEASEGSDASSNGGDARVAASNEAPDSAEKPAVAPQRDPERDRGREAALEDAPAAAPAPAPAATPAPADGPSTTNGRVKASPLARRIARERGLELAGISGTGPDGRIVAADVERAQAGAAAPVAAAAVAAVQGGEVESRPLSNIRKTIARRLTQAWTVPAFQLTVDVDMTRAAALVVRQRELNPDVRITVTDVLTKVCAQALIRHRDMNVQYTEDALLVFPSADVGIAVAAPQGLVVPVVRNAERLSIAQIAAARTDLVSRARDAKLRSEDLEGGTFTISNLGMYDVDQFVAVLNPPQASILAVGQTRDQVVPRDGELRVVPVMTMTLTCDHRAVDGATGADFLRTIKAFLEDPGLAL
jgi:pyruvate dehydrogenase E2 component (dihydrolipoamide acetyltransferase)